MSGLFVLILLSIYILLAAPFFEERKKKRMEKPEETPQVKKLWTIAQESMKSQHNARAEKALLALLSFDEKNAAAYNRLGILYTKEQKPDAAKRCFEIAQSLDKNPALFHNTGLIYLELGEYEKAAMAFRQALEMEGDLPSRFIALSKAEEKLGHLDAAAEALELAFELDHSAMTLRQLLSIHELRKDEAAIADVTARIEEQMVENNKIRDKKLTSVSKKFTAFRKSLTDRTATNKDMSNKTTTRTSATARMATTHRPKRTTQTVSTASSTKNIRPAKRIRKKLIQ